MIKIVTDSTSDLSPDVARQHGIEIVPLEVVPLEVVPTIGIEIIPVVPLRPIASSTPEIIR